MRKMLVTVRLPGARMAPTSRTSAWRQVRWRKSGAKAKMIAAKRAGRSGMAVSLGGDTPTYRIVRFAASALPNHLPEMAKVELRGSLYQDRYSCHLHAPPLAAVSQRRAALMSSSNPGDCALGPQSSGLMLSSPYPRLPWSCGRGCTAGTGGNANALHTLRMIDVAQLRMFCAMSRSLSFVPPAARIHRASTAA
jgi:hypothetical protein